MMKAVRSSETLLNTLHSATSQKTAIFNISMFKLITPHVKCLTSGSKQTGVLSTDVLKNVTSQCLLQYHYKYYTIRS